MLYIWGRNDNQLIRYQGKKKYSVPQKITLSSNVVKCCCDHEYVAILTLKGQLGVLSRGTFYQIKNIPQIRDIQVWDNSLIGVTKQGKTLAWDSIHQLIEGNVKATEIQTKERISSVYMGYDDIFLVNEKYEVYHMKRNSWYETKSYTNPQKIRLDYNIVQIAAGQAQNIFLTSKDTILYSEKSSPTLLHSLHTNQKFIHVAATDHQAAITKSGSVMVWGNTFNGYYQTPQIFSKLTKRFIMVALGRQNGYAVSDDGEVWGWGKNFYGELGVSDYQPRYKPFPLMTLEGEHVSNVFAGNGYACCTCQKNVNKKTANRRNSHCGGLTSHFTLGESESKQINNAMKNREINKVKEILKNNIELGRSKEQNEHKMEIKRKGQSRQCSSRTRYRQQNQQKKSKVCKTPLQSRVSTPRKFKNKENQIKPDHFLLSHHKASLNYQTDQIESKLKIINLQEENNLMRKKLKDKEIIIKDITMKMILLEGAIEHHQKTLTHRDIILDQYQTREKQFQKYIQYLQNTLSTFTTTVPQINHYFRQRQYNIHQHQSYQKQIRQNRQNRQNRQIRQIRQNRQNIDYDYDYDQNIYHKRLMDNNSATKLNYYQRTSKIQEGSIEKVQNIIKKIQENKTMISRSADKLISILERSP